MLKPLKKLSGVISPVEILYPYGIIRIKEYRYNAVEYETTLTHLIFKEKRNIAALTVTPM